MKINFVTNIIYASIFLLQIIFLYIKLIFNSSNQSQIIYCFTPKTQDIKVHYRLIDNFIKIGIMTDMS